MQITAIIITPTKELLTFKADKAFKLQMTPCARSWLHPAMRHFTPTDFHHIAPHWIWTRRTSTIRTSTGFCSGCFRHLGKNSKSYQWPSAWTWFHDGHSSVNISNHRGLQNALHGEGPGYWDCDHHRVGTYHPSADHQTILTCIKYH